MKKNFTLLVIALLTFGACSKKSSGNSNNPNTNYQQPQTYPPNINWQNQGQQYSPQGACGQHQQMPTNCHGSFQGYNYCGNQWYYQNNSVVWAFPAFNSGCGGGGGSHYNGGDNWWDDYNDDDDDHHDDSHDDDNDNDDDDQDHDSDDDDDDDHESSSSLNYNKWVKLWGTMGSSENRSFVLNVPKDGTYYLSIRGDYSGKSQDEEKLKVNFKNSNSHKVKDLENSSSSEKTKTCKVYVNFKLKKGEGYRIYLSGNEDSVNNAQVRVTNYWPSDTSTLCN